VLGNKETATLQPLFQVHPCVHEAIIDNKLSTHGLLVQKIHCLDKYPPGVSVLALNRARQGDLFTFIKLTSKVYFNVGGAFCVRINVAMVQTKYWPKITSPVDMDVFSAHVDQRDNP